MIDPSITALITQLTDLFKGPVRDSIVTAIRDGNKSSAAPSSPGGGGGGMDFSSMLLGPAGIIKEIIGLFNAPSTLIFKQTLNDIMGVIGNSLTPIFRIFNTVARMIGDTLETVSPGFTTLFEIIEAAFIELNPVFKAAQELVIGVVTAYTSLIAVWWDLLGAVFKMLGIGSGIDFLSKAVGYVAQALIGAVNAAKIFVEQLKKLFTGQKVDSFETMWARVLSETERIWSKAQNEKRSSVGAGTYAASYTDLDAFQKKINEASYSMGLGLARDMEKERRDAENARNLAKIAEQTGKDGIAGGIAAYIVKEMPGLAKTMVKFEAWVDRNT